MNRIFVIFILIIAGSCVMARDRTTRTGLVVAPSTAAPVAIGDTVVATDSSLVITGYDKPLRSRKETLFITNNNLRHLLAVELTLRYVDMSGRQLHESTRWIPCDIPAGETRQLSFKSWDEQLSFYYYLSRPPRTESVTPYNVECTPVRLILSD